MPGMMKRGTRLQKVCQNQEIRVHPHCPVLTPTTAIPGLTPTTAALHDSISAAVHDCISTTMHDSISAAVHDCECSTSASAVTRDSAME